MKILFIEINSIMKYSLLLSYLPMPKVQFYAFIIQLWLEGKQQPFSTWLTLLKCYPHRKWSKNLKKVIRWCKTWVVCRRNRQYSDISEFLEFSNSWLSCMCWDVVELFSVDYSCILGLQNVVYLLQLLTTEVVHSGTLLQNSQAHNITLLNTNYNVWQCLKAGRM